MVLNVKTLFVSGYTSGLLGEGMVDPGLELLQKPFSPNDLLSRVRGLLDERRSNRVAPDQRSVSLLGAIHGAHGFGGVKLAKGVPEQSCEKDTVGCVVFLAVPCAPQ